MARNICTHYYWKLAGDSILKGLAGGAIGLLISCVGISHAAELNRFTLNIPELRGGVSLVAALIGVFAVPQVLSMILGLRKQEYVAEYKSEKGVVLKTILKVLSKPVHFLGQLVLEASLVYCQGQEVLSRHRFL